MEISKKFRIKTYVDGNGILRRSARCSKFKKIRNNVIRERMYIKNSVLDYIKSNS